MPSDQAADLVGHESDANYYAGSLAWGDLTHDESSKSLRLFAEEVMPALAESTDRAQRAG